MKFRNLLLMLTTSISLTVIPSTQADNWEPGGPITLQVGFNSGGSTDTLGRAIAKSMEENNGWDVIVENKPGGGGVAMFSGLVRKKPDGKLMGMGVTVPTLMNLALRGDSLPFKVDSFDYLATVVLAPLAIVAPADAPYNTFAEFVEHSKANDGALIGFDAKPQEMMMRAIMKKQGTQFDLVSHKSGAEIIQSLLGGHVDVGFGAGAHIKYVESGELKMLGVATKERQGYSPDTQSLIEQGYPYSVEPYFYIAAPKGLDPKAKEALSQALDTAINSDTVKEIVSNVMITEPVNLGPDGTQEKLKSGLDAVNDLVKAAAE